MRRKKIDTQHEFISAAHGGKHFCTADGKQYTEQFARVYKSTVMNRNFIKLTPAARLMYILSVMESNGQTVFTFPRSHCTLYGMSESTYRRAMRELKKRGFIEEVERYAAQHATKYRFSKVWQILNTGCNSF